MTDSEETREEESKPVRKRKVIGVEELQELAKEGKVDQIRVPGGMWHDLKKPEVGKKQ